MLLIGYPQECYLRGSRSLTCILSGRAVQEPCSDQRGRIHDLGHTRASKDLRGKASGFPMSAAVLRAGCFWEKNEMTASGGAYSTGFVSREPATLTVLKHLTTPQLVSGIHSTTASWNLKSEGLTCLEFVEQEFADQRCRPHALQVWRRQQPSRRHSARAHGWLERAWTPTGLRTAWQPPARKPRSPTEAAQARSELFLWDGRAQRAAS